MYNVIRLLDILNEVIDTGSIGKDFEKKFTEALRLVGLEFEENASTGEVWDIRPSGDGWVRLLDNNDINIKVANTKWMFGSSKFSSMLPWDDIDQDDIEKGMRLIRRFINKKKINDVLYLKPKSIKIQNSIIAAVDNKNIEELEKILVNTNFYAEKLGRDYDVRILTKDNRVTSIVIDKNGKPFMRSERPRNINGTVFVGFKKDNAQYKNTTRIKSL